MSDFSIQHILANEHFHIQQKLDFNETHLKSNFESTLFYLDESNEKSNLVQKEVAFSKENPIHFNNIITNTPSSKRTEFNEIVQEMSIKYNVPANLILKVIEVESNFNENAVSSAGAEGLMQLMPGTAKWLGVKNSFNPRENIEGGTKYLRMMLDRYDNNLPLALAAYNAGPGAVDKYKGVPPYKETERYIEKILNE